MPSNSCGSPKTARPVYGAGSGGLNLEGYTDEQPAQDVTKQLRWNIFRSNHRGLPHDEVVRLFNEHFGYKSSET